MIIKAIENMSQMLDVAWGASSGRKGTHDFICDSDLFDADTVSNLPSVFKCAEPEGLEVSGVRAGCSKMASVKFMITIQDKKNLSTLGYSQSQIDKMKPQEAENILKTASKAPAE